jgi:hypothetical protein
MERSQRREPGCEAVDAVGDVGEDWPPTDEFVDPGRLARLVIQEDLVGRLDQHRLALPEFVFDRARRTYDPLRRNVVYPLREHSHEICASDRIYVRKPLARR